MSLTSTVRAARKAITPALQAFLVVAVLATGCWPAFQRDLTGGQDAVTGRMTTSTRSPRMGSLQITIKWPMGPGRDLRGYHTQLIPDSTSRVDVTVTDAGNAVQGSGSVTRLAGQATTSLNVEVPYANNLTVKAEAFPPVNGPAGNTGPIARGTTGGVNINANLVGTAVTMGSLYVPDIAGMNVNVGKVGDDITFSGSNLGPVWAATPSVVFNTATASLVVVNPNTSVTVRVPSGATTGGVRFITDGVRSDLDTVFWVASGVTTSITSAQQVVNGHTLPAGMAYYGTDLRFETITQFVLDGASSATDELADFQASASVPAISWVNTNSLNSLAADASPSVGTTTQTQEATVSFAVNNQTGSIRATLGSLTSNSVAIVAAGIDGVIVNPASFAINARPPQGTSLDSGYTVDQALTATVQSSLPFDDGVTWTLVSTSSDLVISASSTAGCTVTTLAGAAAGGGTLRATSITTIGKTGDSAATVTDNGAVVLDVD